MGYFCSFHYIAPGSNFKVIFLGEDGRGDLGVKQLKFCFTVGSNIYKKKWKILVTGKFQKIKKNEKKAKHCRFMALEGRY